jgi:serine/threonine protein kinase
VYKGRRRATGRVVALKFIAKTGKSERDLRNLRQEIEILRDLRHENIIQMLDAFETRTDFVVVTGACCFDDPYGPAADDEVAAPPLPAAPSCPPDRSPTVGSHDSTTHTQPQNKTNNMTEFAQGELFEVLEDDASLPEDAVRGVARQLVRALHYLHR